MPSPAKRVLRAVFVEAGRASAGALPPELEARGVRRVRAMTLAVGLLFLATIPVRGLLAIEDGHRTLAYVSTIVAAVFAGASLITFLVVRYAKLSNAAVLGAGLFYEVGLCFSLTMVEEILLGVAPSPLRLGAAAVVLLTFPLVVPSPPRWRLAATLASTLSVPLALTYVAVLLEGELPIAQVLGVSFPILVVGALAAWLGQVVHRLRVDVSRALAFGQYELTERLGEGGMGEVWKAHHEKLLRPAAVKLIRAKTAGAYGDAARRRFAREARATGALQSPHTVSLYDFGTTEDGTLYYAMELLEGIDLESFVTRFGPMSPPRVVRVLAQVARSLAEAHALGLVHRDVKPANIYLCRIGTEVDFAKVLDFGLVKPRYLAPDSPVSVAGAVSGTPGYVAPEAATGADVDARADLYSLGCVAYYLLTGRRVFDARSKLELMTAHLMREPTPPSVRAPEQGIGPGLDLLVLSLLERQAEQRLGSAHELLDRLETLAEELPWSARSAEAWWVENLPEASRPRHELVL